MESGDDTTKKTQPPRFAPRMLQMFCPTHLFNELDGDLLEEYHEAQLAINQTLENRKK